jgi:serpin B
MTLLVLAVGAVGRAGDERGGRGAMGEVVQGNNRFAADLYGRLRERPGNLFFSPYSLSTALAMSYAGARGETAAQMARVMHFDRPGEGLHEAFDALGQALNADATGRGYRLSVANRLWGQSGFHILPEFLALTRQRYGAELALVDFARQPEQARQQINEWVEGRTQGKITDLIPSGLFQPTTRLVLTNAVYFKGDWSRPFDKSATREEPFHISAGREVRVPLMHRLDRLDYFEGDGLKVVGLPYGKGDLSMFVLLPDAADGLAELEGRLSAENLAKWLGGVRSRRVDVALPRFKLTSQFSLASALKSLGMDLAFDAQKADFSGVATQEQLYIAAVVHKAFVAVDEEGTEAAAATGVVAGARAAAVPQKPAVFRADHPFVFLIRDNRTGSLLFLGRVTDPKG